jgi:hypothetical protein
MEKNNLIINNVMITILTACGAVLFAISIFLYYLYIEKSDKLARAESTIRYYDETYLRKQGATSLYNGTMLNYDLRSFDGGLTWYAVEVDEYYDKYVVNVLGKADTIYPDLIKHLDAWDKLSEYVRDNGPIGSKPIDSTLQKIMDDAKIKIVNNEHN